LDEHVHGVGEDFLVGLESEEGVNHVVFEEA
jgi:hypothetical protein